MGKILVKAQQQNVFNLNGSGNTKPAYVLRPVRYNTMNAEDIINYCSANSIVPKAYLSASMIALAQCIENFLLNDYKKVRRDQTGNTKGYVPNDDLQQQIETYREDEA